VTNAVQLSDIFNALDPKTRRAFQVWQQELAVAIQKGNDQNLNNVLGNLPSFAADATDILKVLDVEHASVVRLLVNGGTTFAAISKNQQTLRNLITSAQATFATTAANNNALAATFHVFPTFLDETKATMARLQSFALDADPVVKELEPVAQALGPTMTSIRKLSPYLRNFFVKLGPLITVSQTGLPAYTQVINGARPLLGQLGPFLEQLNPIFNWLSLHQQLISDFLTNGAAGIAATTKSFSGNGVGHYLRQFSPTGPETLSFWTNRDPNNRGNTYPPPLWLADKRDFTANGQGSNSFIFPAWDCKNTGSPGNGKTPAIPGVRVACWVAPPLPGSPGHYKIPRIRAKHYSSH
jgi:ABC-type transporter Mla subunit MlaD